MKEEYVQLQKRLFRLILIVIDEVPYEEYAKEACLLSCVLILKQIDYEHNPRLVRQNVDTLEEEILEKSEPKR